MPPRQKCSMRRSRALRPQMRSRALRPQMLIKPTNKKIGSVRLRVL